MTPTALWVSCYLLTLASALTMSNPTSGGFFAISKNGTETTIYRDGQPVGNYHQADAMPEPRARMRAPLDPNKFQGPKLKIERAKHHIVDLENIASAFASRNVYEMTHEIEHNTGDNIFRIVIKEDIPIEVSAVVGDAVHNLRCALDHMVCDLARANNQTPHQNGGFPTNAQAKRLKIEQTAKLKGVSPSAEKGTYISV